MYAFWKPRYFIRGIQKVRIVVPAFGAVHIFVSSPPCVGVLFLFFFNTSAARMLEKLVSWKFPNDFASFGICAAHACFTFFDCFEKCDSHLAWGSHFQSEISGGELLRCRIVKISLKNKSKIMFRVTKIKILVVCDNELAQWNDDNVAKLESQPRPQPQ